MDFSLQRAARSGIAILLAMTSTLTSASEAGSGCDAACLRGQLDNYLGALTKRTPAQLKTAPQVRFTENGQVMNWGQGLWQGASGLGKYRQYFTDAVSQQAMFYGVVEEAGKPALLSLRIGLKDGQIAEVEHIIARKGSHPLFAPEAFDKPHPALSKPIPAAKRLSRDKLIAIADTYMEGIQKHDSKVILASDTCQRIENGVQTTNRPGRGSRNCAHSADLLTYIQDVTERRFPIVDAEHGIVVSNFIFRIPGETSAANDSAISHDTQVSARLRQPRTLLLTEWFKIDDGKIQHIEAIMHNLPPDASSGWK